MDGQDEQDKPPKGIELRGGEARMSEARFAAWSAFVFLCGVVFALVTSYDMVCEKVRHDGKVAEARVFKDALDDCDRSEESLVAMYRAGEAYFAQTLKNEVKNSRTAIRMPPFSQTVAAMSESCAASLWADIERERKRDGDYIPNEDALRKARNAKSILAYVLSDCERRRKSGDEKGKGAAR